MPQHESRHHDIRPEAEREESMAQHQEFFGELKETLRQGWELLEKARATLERDGTGRG